MSISELIKYRFNKRSSKSGVAEESQLLLSKMSRIRSLRDTQIDFDAELSRARRYKRPLSVIVLRWIGGNDPYWGPGSPTDNPSYPQLLDSLLLGTILPDSIRQTDLVAHDLAAGRYVIMMPEMMKSQAEGATQRLSELFRAHTSASACMGIAGFPEGGLTLEEMIQSADSDCHASLEMAS